MKNNLRDSITTLGLVIILIILWNPYGLYMDFMQLSLLIVLLLLAAVTFTIFIIKDKPVDERDESNLHLSTMVAYFAGAGILLVGIITQVLLDHHIDQWLILALVAMVIGKWLARTYFDRNH